MMNKRDNTIEYYVNLLQLCTVQFGLRDAFKLSIKYSQFFGKLKAYRSRKKWLKERLHCSCTLKYSLKLLEFLKLH